jgi:ribosomal protein S18 acetylase RimI-like enzyme
MGLRFCLLPRRLLGAGSIGDSVRMGRWCWVRTMNEMIDIRPRLDSPEVRELINAMGYPSDIRNATTEQILAEYRENPDQLVLGLESDGRLIAFIGLRRSNSTDAVVRHIVVRPDNRRHGLGREMLLTVCRMLSLKSLAAETDRDAVEFYRRIGFRIRSLGEKYPGVERFDCRLTTEDQQPAAGDDGHRPCAVTLQQQGEKR